MAQNGAPFGVVAARVGIAATALIASAAIAQQSRRGVLQREMQRGAIEGLQDAFARVADGVEAEPFDEACVFFEENATDGDLGVHFFVDGEPWDRLVIIDARGRQYLDVHARGAGRDNGLTEIRSESAEPGFDEVPRDEFLERFPPGDWQFVAWTVEGALLRSVVPLTHDLPAPPVVVFPTEGEEVDAASDLVIQWEAVADPNAPASVIVAYQLVVTEEGDSERELAIDLPPTATSMTIPASFFSPGGEYKYEIVARESSGNQVITEVAFTTAE